MDFSFVYNGEKILSKDLSGKRESDRIYYKYKDIAITQELRSYGSGGAYSLLWFENCGSVNSGTISEICDVDAELEFEKVFAGAQSVEDTLANAQKRADEAIAKAE